MLTPVAEDVLVHQSDFMQTNTVVVEGRTGVLLVDAGVRRDEMECLSRDLRELGQRVVVGFSTHPHWDHLLWHESFGDVPRYGTAACAATARERLSDPGAKERLRAHLIPPEFVQHVPLELLGHVQGLPAGTATLPWDGPQIRLIEHQAHAPGHAALLVEERGVLIAGDMLSDILIPMLDLSGAIDPAGDYLNSLQLLENAAGTADVLVPGHGTVARAGQVRARFDADRAYVHSLGGSRPSSDSRLAADYSQASLPDLHERQLQHVASL